MPCIATEIMQAMYVRAALAVIVFTTASSAANQTRPDLNPALGSYQDERDCFPFMSNLNQIYRNFKSDPYFGGEAKCVKADPTGSLHHSQLQATFEYGSTGVLCWNRDYGSGATLKPAYEFSSNAANYYSNGSLIASLNKTSQDLHLIVAAPGYRKTKMTVASSPGYNVGNVLEFQPRDHSLQPFNFTAAYRDCQNCKVFRHSYADNGNGCSYWVTDEALGQETTCCEFVYELLCGTSPKYQIYDESCQ